MGAPLRGWPLEPDGAQMRELVEAAMARLVPTVETYPQQPIYDVEGAVDAAAALIAAMPDRGQPLDETLALIFDRATPHSFGTPMPGYLAYIPGGGLFHSAVADLIGDTLNRYSGVWQAAPGLVQLETNVLRWLCDEVGYGKGARGFLTTGGSLANFSALVVARREKLPPDFLRGTVYCSDQVHHSLQKAAMLAGLPAENVRALPCDARFRLAPAAVEAAIREDRARGPGALHAGRLGRHREHRRRRPAAGARRRRGARGPVVPRRRRLRRLLRAHRTRPRRARRHRARRLGDARPAQGALPALRHRLPAGARRRGARPRPRAPRRLPAGAAAGAPR